MDHVLGRALRYRLPVNLVAVAVGYAGAYIAGVREILPAVLAGLVAMFGLDVWWRRTHDPSEDRDI